MMASREDGKTVRRLAYTNLIRFQCRDRRIQKYSIYCMGCGWAGQDPALVEALLPEHSGNHLRGGQQRS